MFSFPCGIPIYRQSINLYVLGAFKLSNTTWRARFSTSYEAEKHSRQCSFFAHVLSIAFYRQSILLTLLLTRDATIPQPLVVELQQY